MAVAQLAALKEEPPDPSELNPGPSTSNPDHFDLVNLEQRILTLCAENPKGITNEMITRDQPHVHVERRMNALQRLLSQVHVYHGWVLIMLSRYRYVNSLPCSM